jgi:serine/threonine protein kinase
MRRYGGGLRGDRHKATDAPIALKRMLPEHVAQRARVVNFMREYHSLSELKHPRIIEVFDYGVDSHGPYYTMELLDGQDLRELSPTPFRDAAQCLRDTASLKCQHDSQYAVVHADLRLAI